MRSRISLNERFLVISRCALIARTTSSSHPEHRRGIPLPPRRAHRIEERSGRCADRFETPELKTAPGRGAVDDRS